MKLLELGDRGLREALVGKLRQRRAPPQRQRRRAGSRPPSSGLARRQRVSALLDRSPEPVEVKLTARDTEARTRARASTAPR